MIMQTNSIHFFIPTELLSTSGILPCKTHSTHFCVGWSVETGEEKDQVTALLFQGAHHLLQKTEFTTPEPFSPLLAERWALPVIS